MSDLIGKWSVNEVQQADLLALCRGLPDHGVDMILCDLPYGTTACAWDAVIPFEPMWAEFKRVIKPQGAIVLTAAQPFASACVMSNPLMFRYEWIWEKSMATGFPNANNQPLRAHEQVLIFSHSVAVGGVHKSPMRYYPIFLQGSPYAKTGRSSSGQHYNGKTIANDLKGGSEDGRRYPRSVLEIANPNHGSLHPTQKPVALFEYLIRTYTQENDLVLDLCVGSGTTAVAARNTKRRFICGDLSAEYVAIARDRLRLPFEQRRLSINDDVNSLPLFKRNDAGG